MIPKNQRKSKAWFDSECYAERRKTLHLLQQARQQKTGTELQRYAEQRRRYKQLIKHKRTTHIEEQAKIQAQEALGDPFRALRKKVTSHINQITVEAWEKHFSTILNKDNKAAALEIRERSNTRAPTITLTEVAETMASMKNRKAAGPDGIYNENLKDSLEILGPIWTKLFNKCIETGNIPESWRRSHIKVLYKGKGRTDDQHSYRGIALENNALKVYTRILTQRLTRETENQLPEEQFGFRKGRGTLHAISNLLNDIQEALRHRRGKFYTVFIDYTKAFDLLNREHLVKKLEHMIGRDNPLTIAINNLLAYNTIEIEDGISSSTAIRQTNGVLQGDPISPTLFNIATADVTKIIENSSVVLYAYADDMILGSKNREELQETMSKLQEWTETNKLHLNTDKTVSMVFRKGGRITAQDKITYAGQTLTTVGSFRYLGITLQSAGTSYRIHIRERAASAIKGIYDIQNPTRISIETAMLLFHAKITPTLTYGIQLIWEQLTLTDLQTLERVKARFLKRILGIAKTAPSRLAYMLARETFLIEDIRYNLLLPSTPQAEEHLRRRRQKREEIWPEFFTTEAMLNRKWSGPNQELRSAITRLSIHGFHHKLCSKSYYHEPTEDCRCKLCGEECERYHFNICAKRVNTLSEYSKK